MAGDKDLNERVLALMPSPKDGARMQAALAAAGIHCVACADVNTLCAEIERGGRRRPPDRGSHSRRQRRLPGKDAPTGACLV